MLMNLMILIMTALSTATGVATLIIVLVQLRLMRRQTDIMGKHAELLARRAVPVACPKVRGRRMDGAVEVDFRFRNDGSGTLRNFYWQVGIPVAAEFRPFRLGEGGTTPQVSLTGLEGVQYYDYHAYEEQPIYPTRDISVGIATLKPDFNNGLIRFMWRVVSEDGAFPERAYNVVECNIS
jgi:hypothetical protein